VAVVYGGGIWTAQRQPKPLLSLSFTAANARIGWIVPSTNFVLEQSADLVSWTDVTNPLVFNPTNEQNEITLPPTNSSSFYRLKTP